MSATRRNWIQGLLGALSLCVVWRRTAKGQTIPAGRSCSGTVSDALGNGIANVVVEMVEPSGRVSSGMTDAQGIYGLAAPKSGPFVIVFREPQGNTRLLDVRDLTAETNQMLSVTIDPTRRSFLAVYNALQAVETLLTWVIADRENTVGPTLFRTISDQQLRATVDLVVAEFDRIRPTDRQRDLIFTKAEFIRTLLPQKG